jgi:CO dehydrogenase/acetyl-CoA synthase beta subunit
MSRPTDMRELIRAVKKMAAKNQSVTVDAAGEDKLSGYLSRMNSGCSEAWAMVMAQDTEVELGSPKRASVNTVLWTREKELVTDNRCHVIGPDLSELKAEDRDYCQIVMLEIKPGREPDPFLLEPGQFLTDRIPGVMARMIPGRLWLRVSRRAVKAGVNFSIIAAVIRKAYCELPGVKAVECIFADSDRDAVQGFAGLASEARILSGRHKRISLGRDGDYECEELDCASCEDKPVCDIIREVRVIRKRESAAART